MPYKFNPFTGNLDLVGSSGSGGGDVSGPGSSTDKAIARWNGTSGTLIQDSNTLVQDSGAINAQAFIFNRQVLADVVVPNHYSTVNSDVEMVTGDIYLLGDSQLILL